MKLKYLFALTLAAITVSSCSEDIMDKINFDEAHPGTKITNGAMQLTDAEMSTVFSTLQGNYAWYVSSYTEQLFGTGNNQMKNAELRQTNEVAASTTFDNEWNSTYLNLNNLYNIKAKCQKGGTNSGQRDLLGMEQTLEAIGWATLTDLHGDIPYKECFKGILTPAINTQKEVYDHVFELLDSAQVNFAAGGKNVGSKDLLYGGDVSKWGALVHALRARYLLRTYATDKTPARLNKVLTEANAALAAGFDGCSLSVFNNNNPNNSWTAYQWSRHYVGCSTTVTKLMEARKDPREVIYNYAAFYKPGENEVDTVAAPGDKELACMVDGVNYPAWLDNGGASSHVMSISELYFIITEVKARLGQKDEDAFRKGVKASLSDYFAQGGSVAEASLSDDAANAYLDKMAKLYDADPLKETLVQKYLAQTRDEQLETYNDIRRCKALDGSYPVALTNPNNTVSGKNRWPLRLPYGNSDVVSNPNVAKVFGSGNDAGNYIYTDPVWWAGGKE